MVINRGMLGRPRKSGNNDAQRVYGSGVLFSANEVRVINRRWNAGDQSVRVMKQMLNDTYTPEKQAACELLLGGD